MIKTKEVLSKVVLSIESLNVHNNLYGPVSPAIEGAEIKAGEWLLLTITSNHPKVITFKAIAEIDQSTPDKSITTCLGFPETLLKPNVPTEILAGPLNGDGRFVRLLLADEYPEASRQPPERKLYSAPVLERLEFTLQPAFFMAGGDAIRTAAERAPKCHEGCTWNAVTSFLLGTILPHYDDDAKLKAAARIIIPKIIELQALATADDPVEFARAKRATCWIDEPKESDNAKHN